jgi:hypothetical protein
LAPVKVILRDGLTGSFRRQIKETKMPTPDVQLTQEEDVQGEVVTSVEANSEEFRSKPLLSCL